MPKAQVLVTLTAEAFMDVPEGIEDVDRFVRDNVALVWGDATIGPMQAPAVSVEYFFLPIPEPEVEEELEVETVEAEAEAEGEAVVQFSDTLPLPVLPVPFADVTMDGPKPEGVPDLSALLDDPAYRTILRKAVSDRAARLLEAVVDQVVAELEPLLRRHYEKNATGAQ